MLVTFSLLINYVTVLKGVWHVRWRNTDIVDIVQVYT